MAINFEDYTRSENMVLAGNVNMGTFQQFKSMPNVDVRHIG